MSKLGHRRFTVERRIEENGPVGIGVYSRERKQFVRIFQGKEEKGIGNVLVEGVMLCIPRILSRSGRTLREQVAVTARIGTRGKSLRRI